MIYLIGGAPRVGKSTIVKHIVKQQPMHAISTDAIRYMLRHAVPAEALDPAIFLDFHQDIMNSWSKDPAVTLDEQNQQSKAYWPALKQLLASYDKDGMDIVMEGSAILPAFVSTLGIKNQTVFIGNTSDQHADIIKAQARASEHDWMHAYSDEAIASAASFFKYMSTHLQAEAEHFGMAYFEITDDNFDQSLDLAANYLLGL